MKTKLFTLLLALSVSLAFGQTRTNITVTKTITDEQLAGLISSVSQMHRAFDLGITTTNLLSVTVKRDESRFILQPKLKPIQTFTTNTVNGAEIVIEQTQQPRVPALSLNAQQMGAIFAAAIGEFGETTPQITLDNFTSITLTQSESGWIVTAKVESKNHGRNQINLK